MSFILTILIFQFYTLLFVRFLKSYGKMAAYKFIPSDFPFFQNGKMSGSANTITMPMTICSGSPTFT